MRKENLRQKGWGMASLLLLAMMLGVSSFALNAYCKENTDSTMRVEEASFSNLNEGDDEQIVNYDSTAKN